jgi:hypothetical protein
VPREMCQTVIPWSSKDGMKTALRRAEAFDARLFRP